MIQQTTNRSSRANFTLGNEEWVKKSSHQCDFGLNGSFKIFKIPKPVPPIPAKIFPNSSTKELGKWKSSTTQDFQGFGGDARRLAYETSTKGFQEIKAVQNQDEAFLKENCRQSLTTRYHADFGNPSIYSHEGYAFRQRLMRIYPDQGPRNNKFISEASHAFQWPSSHRVKLPPHLRVNSS